MQFQRSPLLETIERAYRHPRQRFLLGLEEFNRCPTPAQNASLAAMDKTRTIRHPIENKHVVIPSNVSFIAAINRGAQYTGTFDIDRAQLDRFEPIEINYMPAEQEVAFLKKEYPRVGKEKIETIVAIANKIRSAPEMPCELSVRATSGACVFLNDPLVASERGSFLIDVLKSAFCGRLNGHWDEQGSEASIAWRLIQESLA
jgi:MoxR-like ATPase